MIILVTENPDQINMLEWELIKNHVDYELEYDEVFNLTQPHLIIDGVPLDFERSMKWVKERFYEN